MSGAIAVFVKTPGISPVKTRLAVSLGQKTAESFHLASARAVAAVLQATGKLNDIHSYYAVAEQSALDHDCYWQEFSCLWQGEGGLGERMDHVYQTLLKDHDFVILVGADIPQMTTAELLSATTWLLHDEQARLVFGPSVDGGFWLIGGNCSIPQNIWTEVTYSVADTGAQFLNKIKSVGDIHSLSLLRDIDEPNDLVLLRRTLLELINPLPEQQQLLLFLDSLSIPSYHKQHNA